MNPPQAQLDQLPPVLCHSLADPKLLGPERPMTDPQVLPHLADLPRSEWYARMCAEAGAEPDEVVSRLLGLQDYAHPTFSTTSFGSRVAEAEMAQAAVVAGGASQRDAVDRVIAATHGQSIEELAAALRFATSMQLSALKTPELEEAGVRLRNLRTLLARLVSLPRSTSLSALGEAIQCAALHGITDWPELAAVQSRYDLLAGVRKRLLAAIPSRRLLDASSAALESVTHECEALGLQCWPDYGMAKSQLEAIRKHVSCMNAPGKSTAPLR
eukprot:gnl/MRDRNA2_/MRDRNA2_69124_c0_seq3.p1 gnl/MRDRNA2_/MRDRNA2_69124_c0~~gnl/MRDRNA2_/MRDRNA2_69124_c0_seq3.p1  ORF type:complete len:271 (+),score=47.80 gnl/MRDRNA2_/MRDRNA2_69124_c0_seq3:82-894(+)